MGYRMTRNFALPLFSKSLVEFWRRWHISLYSWFSDYVYTPFVINKRYWGKWAVVTGLLFTFFISGLWHGASWNYVIWGVLNGAFIAIETLFLVRTADRSKLSFPKKVFYTFLVFQLYSFTMIFFRSRTLHSAYAVVLSVFNPHHWANLRIADTSIFINMLCMLLLLLSFDYFIFRKNTFETLFLKTNRWVFTSFMASLIILVYLFGVSNGDQFIYFQF